ncbi:hypothetical protein [Streptomyces sp. NRRL B-3229]|uniref:hypothetical protein n=1 Tax=Streptomyces sp. NRRL B-3229 TaxID=1463836 RepID=UPI00068F1C78|nr:hypothetical protein [Streptomyces sp. NRRL B-3229]
MGTEAGRRSWSVGVLTPYACTVLDAFGLGRSPFGSDCPVRRPAVTYPEVIATGMAVRTCHLSVTTRPAPHQEAPCA